MPNPAGKSKGALTAEKILDAAESLCAKGGYGGTSLREIARQVGIHEPGIYNHFDGKEALYAAVIDRALTPMLEAMRESMAASDAAAAYAELPGIMTDRLAAHPQMAALFHQTLQSDASSASGQLIEDWLNRLFRQGMATLDSAGTANLDRNDSDRNDLDPNDFDRHDMAIRVIALFNLTTGYFLSQRAFSSLVGCNDDLTSPSNIARQKRILSQLVRSMLGD